MKVREVFAGYRVFAYPMNEGWVVGLSHQYRGEMRLQAFSNVDDALIAVRQWTEILTDGREILEDDPMIADELRALIEEATIRYEVDGEDEGPEDDEAVVANERLREWFERQMGSNA
jgi:hypothetical protein